MIKKQRHWLPPVRTTVPLTGTVAKTHVSLDHASVLGIAYAQAWLLRNGSKKVPPSGVIRRALSLYLAHLDSPDTSPRDEVAAVRNGCQSFTPDDEARKAALERLQQANSTGELPPWRDVLYGPQWRSERAALDARVDEHMRAIAASPWGRLKSIRA